MRNDAASPADLIAHRILEHCGLPARPPIDIEYVALQLGIAEIASSSTAMSGRLDHSNNSVILASSDGRRRQRFTIAHEVGHLVLADHADWFVPVADRPGSLDEAEVFCDKLAAALLMPRAALLDHFMSVPSKIEGVRDLAKEANVSFSAAFIRSRATLGWNDSLLQLSHGTQRSHSPCWYVSKVLRRVKGLHQRPILPESAQRQLDDYAGRSPDRARRGDLSVLIGKRLELFRSEVLIRPGTGFALGSIARPARTPTSARPIVNPQP